MSAWIGLKANGNIAKYQMGADIFALEAKMAISLNLYKDGLFLRNKGRC